MITHLTFWTSFTQRQRQSCTGSGHMTLLDPVKMSNDALDLLIYLFFYVRVSVHERTRSVLRVFVPVVPCVLSLIVRKVFVLHVCIYSCGDVHLHTHSRLMNEETTKGKSLASYVNIVFIQSTAHKSSILRYAQRHEASSSGLKSNLLVFLKCSGMSVIIDRTLSL